MTNALLTAIQEIQAGAVHCALFGICAIHLSLLAFVAPHSDGVVY